MFRFQCPPSVRPPDAETQSIPLARLNHRFLWPSSDGVRTVCQPRAPPLRQPRQTLATHRISSDDPLPFAGEHRLTFASRSAAMVVSVSRDLGERLRSPGAEGRPFDAKRTEDR